MDRAKKARELRRAAIEKIKKESGASRGPASEEEKEPMKSSDYKSFEAEKEAHEQKIDDERLSYFMKAKKGDPDYVKKKIEARKKALGLMKKKK